MLSECTDDTLESGGRYWSALHDSRDGARTEPRGARQVRYEAGQRLLRRAARFRWKAIRSPIDPPSPPTRDPLTPSAIPCRREGRGTRPAPVPPYTARAPGGTPLRAVAPDVPGTLPGHGRARRKRERS